MVQRRSSTTGPRAPWAPWVVAGIAVAVRAAHLGDSLWADEIYTWRVASKSLVDAALHADQTPPLQAVLLHIWMVVAGQSETALRMPAAVAGGVTAGLAVVVARRWLDVRWAVLAGLLVATHPQLVVMGQEARAYAVFAALGTASWWLWLRLWDGERWVTRVAYVVVTAAMLYAHVFGLFFLMAQAAAWLWIRPRPLRAGPAFGLQLAAFVLFAPWLGVLVDRTRYVASGFWIQKSDLGSLAGTTIMIAGGVVLAGLYVGLWLAWTFASRPFSMGKAARVLAPWTLVPALVPYLISFLLPIYTPRYAVPASVGYLILAAGAVAALAPRWRAAAASTLLIVSLLLSLQVAPAVLREPPRTDWRDGVAFVEAHAQPADIVLFWPGYCDSLNPDELACPWAYYGHRTDLELVQIGESNVGLRDDTFAKTEARIGRADHVWLMEVDTGSGPGDPDRWINSRFHRVEDHPFPGLRVAFYSEPS